VFVNLPDPNQHISPIQEFKCCPDRGTKDALARTSVDSEVDRPRQYVGNHDRCCFRVILQVYPRLTHRLVSICLHHDAYASVLRDDVLLQLQPNLRAGACMSERLACHVATPAVESWCPLDDTSNP
jgi:hypothetical protein